eukprot:CAMPEP_0204187510 /NCGR_PEP_ID=MMETSP0361-20130328/56862_1 /ASSEMBLY_ACC=CAM_ASM_000343 /TAXON_ID=268821 /ORGANISM="Scrippsiella Hangoei, Strain SHTV-5" /LENGTH=32 /DNA_ID= /DNA_START= /DNA_END= /DNA_ORIENTATION=
MGPLSGACDRLRLGDSRDMSDAVQVENRRDDA